MAAETEQTTAPFSPSNIAVSARRRRCSYSWERFSVSVLNTNSRSGYKSAGSPNACKSAQSFVAEASSGIMTNARRSSLPQSVSIKWAL